MLFKQPTITWDKMDYAIDQDGVSVLAVELADYSCQLNDLAYSDEAKDSIIFFIKNITDVLLTIDENTRLSKANSDSVVVLIKGFYSGILAI